jgi:hypothetical protein
MENYPKYVCCCGKIFGIRKNARDHVIEADDMFHQITIQNTVSLNDKRRK